VERNETFQNVETDDSNVIGSLPRVTFSRGEKKIGTLPIYFGAMGEYASLIRTDKQGDLINERGLTRIDVLPGIRVPFTKWPYLTFNTTFTFRETYWSDSQISDLNPVRLSDPINRH